MDFTFLAFPNRPSSLVPNLDLDDGYRPANRRRIVGELLAGVQSRKRGAFGQAVPHTHRVAALRKERLCFLDQRRRNR